MVLDHSGPDLALILYGAHLKLALLGALVARVALGFAGGVAAWLGLLGGLAAFAVAVGVVESTMARLRMTRVPQFLLAASVLSALALVLPVR
jgi:formate hydrogenlyase subunit 4